MIIYCAGYKVHAELIILFLQSDVVKITALRNVIAKIIVDEVGGCYWGNPHAVISHAYSVGNVDAYCGAETSAKIHQCMMGMRELERQSRANSKEFHVSEVREVESGLPSRFQGVCPSTILDDGNELYVHDGGDFLIVREGATGPRHNIKIAAIDMIEFTGRL